MKIKLDALYNIGLTRKEAEIYTALLELSESPVADLIERTHTHPQIVYSALKSLTKKELVITSYKRHRRYVCAEDPMQLKIIAKERLTSLEEILPQLQSLHQTPTEAIVRVYNGCSAVRDDRERAINILSAGETLYIVGGGAQGKFIQIMREQHVEIERARVKKGIKKRMLAYANQKELIERTNPILQLAQTRYLPEDFATPTSLFVYAKFSSIVIWQPLPVVITIESQAVAQSYRQYFNSLWRIALK